MRPPFVRPFLRGFNPYARTLPAYNVAGILMTNIDDKKMADNCVPRLALDADRLIVKNYAWSCGPPHVRPPPARLAGGFFTQHVNDLVASPARHGGRFDLNRTAGG